MITFFLSLAAFVALTILMNNSGEKSSTALGAYVALPYLVTLSFFFYVVLRFKENADRFDELLQQRSKLQGLVKMLETERSQEHISQDDYYKNLTEYNRLLDTINKHLSLRKQELKSVIGKSSIGFSEKAKFTIVNFFSMKKIKLEEEESIKKMPKEDIEKVYRLMILLEPYKTNYSEKEIKLAILSEGYTEDIAQKVIEILYAAQ